MTKKKKSTKTIKIIERNQPLIKEIIIRTKNSKDAFILKKDETNKNQQINNIILKKATKSKEISRKVLEISFIFPFLEKLKFLDLYFHHPHLVHYYLAFEVVRHHQKIHKH